MMLRIFLVASFSILLHGCGGGGGGGAPASAQQANRAPTSISLANSTVLEGTKGSTIGTLSTSDPDGGGFNYTLSGDDSSSFQISGSSLRLASETAADYETKSSYSITIKSTDSGGLSTSKDFTITVIDAIEGRIVDGPLSGSNVFIDLNNNSIQNVGEPNSTSDSNGYFSVENLTESAEGLPKLVSIGGTDTQTGKTLPNLALIADLPSDKSQKVSVTPITTVIAAAETAEAKAEVLQALGISSSVEELLTTDNWAAAEAGDEAAKELQRKIQQVGLIIQTADTLTDSATAMQATELSKSVAKQLVQIASNNQTIDLTKAETLNTVLGNVIAEVDPNTGITSETITAVSNSLSDVNTFVGDSSLDPIGDDSKEIIEAAQTTLQESVEKLTTGSVDLSTFQQETASKTLFENASSSTVLEALVAISDKVSVLEGSKTVGNFSIPSSEAETLKIELASGLDGASFTLSTEGALSFTNAPDYENPSDSDTNNSYEVSISATDGSFSTTKTVSVNILDAIEGRVVDGPISGSTVFIDNNNNNLRDSDESSTTSDASGYFFLNPIDRSTMDAGLTLISLGGTDTATQNTLDDLALTATLIENSKLSVTITPISTVLNQSSDQASLLKSFGLSSTAEEFSGQDPWLLAEGSAASSKFSLRTNLQLGMLFQAVNSFIKPNALGNAHLITAKNLALVIARRPSSETINLTSAAYIESVIGELLTELRTKGIEFVTVNDLGAENGSPSSTIETTKVSAIAASIANLALVLAEDSLDPKSAIASNILKQTQVDLGRAISGLLVGSINLTSFSEEAGTKKLLAKIGDADGDGYADLVDAFASDSSEWADFDGDGTGDNADNDDDNDGVADASDAFPLDPRNSLDTDKDGIGNETDEDDDNDGVRDEEDAFPLNVSEFLDTDGDGIGNNEDLDDDNDGVADTADAFPIDPLETADADSDGIGDVSDLDDDNDGVADTVDVDPNSASLTKAVSFNMSNVAAVGLGNSITAQNEAFASSSIQSSNLLSKLYDEFFGKQPIRGTDDSLSGTGITNLVSFDSSGNIILDTVKASKTLFIAEASLSPDRQYLYLLTSKHMQDRTSGLDGEVCSMYRVKLADNSYNCLLLTKNGDIEPKSLISVSKYDFGREGMDFRADGSAVMQGFDWNQTLPENVPGGTNSTVAWYLDPAGKLTRVPTEEGYYVYGVLWVDDETFVAFENSQCTIPQGSSGNCTAIAGTTPRLAFYNASTLQRTKTISSVPDGDNKLGRWPLIRYQDELHYGNYKFAANDSALTRDNDRSFEALTDPTAEKLFSLNSKNGNLYLDQVKPNTSISLRLTNGGYSYDTNRQSPTGSDIKYKPFFFKDDYILYRETLEPAKPLKSVEGTAYSPNAQSYSISVNLSGDRGTLNVKHPMFTLYPSQSVKDAMAAALSAGNAKTTGVTIDYVVSNGGTDENKQFTIPYDRINHWLNVKEDDNVQAAIPETEREGLCVHKISSAQTKCTALPGYDVRVFDAESHRLNPEGRIADRFAGIQTQIIAGDKFFAWFKDSSTSKYHSVTASLETFLSSGDSALTFAESQSSSGDARMVENAVQLPTGDFGALAGVSASKGTADKDVLNLNVNFGQALSSIATNPDIQVKDPVSGKTIDVSNGVWASDRQSVSFSINTKSLSEDCSCQILFPKGFYIKNRIKRYLPSSTLTFELGRDFDGDGIIDKEDADDDNDGVADTDDAFPLDASETLDTDSDGIGNNADTDDDGDTLSDTYETEKGLNPLSASDATLDTDGDGTADWQEKIAGTSETNKLDSPYPSVIQIESGNHVVSESTGKVKIYLNRLFSSAGELSVDYATANERAQAGTDYQATSGTITWSDGDKSTKTIEVSITNNETQLGSNDGTFSFLMKLSNLVGSNAYIARDRATVTITEDDLTGFDQDGDGTQDILSKVENQYPGRVRWVNYGTRAAEDSGSVTIWLERLGGTKGAVSASIGTRADDFFGNYANIDLNKDITLSDTTLSWADGESGSKSITITIQDDAIPEPGKAFALSIKKTSGGLGKPTSYFDTKLVILDDDATSPTGYLVPASILYRVTESPRPVPAPAPIPAGTNPSSSTTTSDNSQSTETVNDTKDHQTPVSYLRLGGKSGIATATLYNGSATRSEHRQAKSGRDYDTEGGNLPKMTWTDGELGTKQIIYSVYQDSDFEVHEPPEYLPIITVNTTNIVRSTASLEDTGIQVSILSMRDRYAPSDYPDLDRDGVPNAIDFDVDGDGVVLNQDAFPFDATENRDSDGDGIGDNLDTADDDESKSGDIDADGKDNLVDGDMDGDGIENRMDDFPLLASEVIDRDNDGVGDNADDFPNDRLKNKDKDTDGDGIGDSRDLDAEGDGVPDALEAGYGLDPTNATDGSTDSDLDGTADWMEIIAQTSPSDASDTPYPSVVQLGTNVAYVSENQGSVKIPLQRLYSPRGALTVKYETADRTAKAGSDYTATSGEVRWEDGDRTTKFIEIPIIDNSVASGSHFLNYLFLVKLTSLDSDQAFLGRKAAHVTIIDDEQAGRPNDYPGGLMWSFYGFTAAEQEKTIDLQVSRLEGHYGSASADVVIPTGWYWCSRFAKPMDPEADLMELPSRTSIDPSYTWTGESSGYTVGTLNWADGESAAKTISIKVRDDREMEGTECLNLILLQKDTNGTIVDNKNVLVYLRDDDLVMPGGYLQAQDRALRIAEHEEDRDFSVLRLGGYKGAQNLALNSDLGVKPASDQLQIKNTDQLRWADGELGSRSFQLRAPADQIATYDEIMEDRYAVLMFQREGSTSNQTGNTDAACDMDYGVPWACIQPRIIVRDSNQDLYPDTDGDGYTDQKDFDVDGDGYVTSWGSAQFLGPRDLFPWNNLEWADSDGDGIGDNTDTEPNNRSVSGDIDGDGIDNIEDDDDDGDGVKDRQDLHPTDASRS